MAIEYDAFIVDGVFVKQQTLSLMVNRRGLQTPQVSRTYKEMNRWFMHQRGSGLRVGRLLTVIRTIRIRPSC
jgi:hypothetical protein